MDRALSGALSRLGIDPVVEIEPEDTTYTVYVLQSVVVKLFPRSDRRAFVRELDGLSRGAELRLPVPRVVAQGSLKRGVRFLVTTRLRGMPLRSFAEITHRDAMDMAVFAARSLRALHDSRRVAEPLEKDMRVSKWCRLMRRRLPLLPLTGWLTRRMHRESARQELRHDSGFWPVNWMALFAWGDEPVYLHGDLNNENVLLDHRKDGSRFSMIDFGDSLFGHRLYDFVAVHLSLFACDKRLLALFLQVYGGEGLPPTAALFAHACFVYCLLSESPAFRTAVHFIPRLSECASLSEMATIVFDVSVP